MPFKKGQSGNPRGRKKGTNNAAKSSDIRDKIKESLSIDDLLTDIEDCRPEHRASLKIKLLEFIVPKLRSIEIMDSSTVEELLTMTPEERRQRIAELKNEMTNGK